MSEGLTAETVVLMAPEEFDAATTKDVSFRPRGSSQAGTDSGPSATVV
ncbi:MAG TPA: hypothetical protein VMG37_04495 [Solirubrobacteraceae bacterium]|nr:hypothetical protein [Solirubrobacteraceae bacterium]